jgi:DNA-binding MarR family transcriptional regulator
VASKDDRRINLIYLTQSAVALQEQTMNMANQTLNEALQGVATADIELCKAVLQQVYDNLSSV